MAITSEHGHGLGLLRYREGSLEGYDAVGKRWVAVGGSGNTEYIAYASGLFASGFTGVHDSLSGMQGGNSEEQYHMTFDQHSGLISGTLVIDPGGDVSIGGATPVYQLHIQGQGELAFLERSTDPSSPAEGNCVIWLSDGSGLGGDGDLMVASTATGTTRYGTIFNHSAGTLWP